MGFTLIAHTTVVGNKDGGTSAAIDTTGADLIVWTISHAVANNPGYSDNQSNFYTQPGSAVRDGNNHGELEWRYKFNPTTSVSHTFTVSGTDSYPSCCVTAWSGSGSFLDGQSAGAGTASATSLQPGSITPSQDNCLVISGFCTSGSLGDTGSIDSGFTLSDQIGAHATYFGDMCAYLIQGSAAAANPTFTLSGSATEIAAQSLVFRPAALASRSVSIAVTETGDSPHVELKVRDGLAIAVTEGADSLAAILVAGSRLLINTTESPDSMSASLGYQFYININSEDADTAAINLTNSGSWMACPDLQLTWAECSQPSTTWTNCTDPTTPWTPTPPEPPPTEGTGGPIDGGAGEQPGTGGEPVELPPPDPVPGDANGPKDFAVTVTETRDSVAATVTGGGAVAPGTGALPIPLTLHNISSSSSFAAPYVSYGHPFADGDVPGSGSIVMTDSNGSPVTVQMDAISTWPSGYVKFAVLSHACSENFGPSSSKAYILGVSAAARNTTPAAGWGSTHADHAAALSANTDFKVEYSGFDCGANTYRFSLNDTFTNFSERGSGWGTSYPAGGWEITKRGPVCVEFHGWGYIKNVSSGKYHGYIRTDIWVKAWGPTGPYEIDVRTTQPNIWNTITQSSTTSENYNVKQARFAALLQVKNGSTVIKYDGGPNDANATVIPNANFNTSTNRLNYAISTGFFQETAIVLASTGSLPSGISANTLYWPAYPNYADQPYLATERTYCSSIEQGNGGTRATFGTQGSGTITAYPVYMAFPGSGWATAEGKGDPIWVGTGTRPTIAPGHDFNYLTQRSKFTLAYNANAGSTYKGTAQPNYLPTRQTGGMQWAQSGTGASGTRIGHANQWQVASYYQPSDPYYYYGVLQGALCWHGSGYAFMMDESGGVPLIATTGTYTGLPANISGWCASNIPGQVDSGIVSRGARWSGWASGTSNDNGLYGQYYADSTHVPMNAKCAYLKTGRPIFLEAEISKTNSFLTMVYQGYQTISGRNYSCLVNGAYGANQLRGWAWSWRDMADTFFQIPDDHPFRPVLRDMYNDNLEYEAARINSVYPANQITAGVPDCLDHDNAGGKFAPWMLAFLVQVVALEHWRGGQTSAGATAIATISNFLANFWARYLPSVNAKAVLYYPAYDQLYTTTQTSADYANCYTDWADMFADTVTAGYLSPAPWPTRLYDHDSPGNVFVTGFPGNTDSYHVFGQCAVSMHALALPGNSTVTGAKAAIKAALSAASGIPQASGGIQWAGTSGGAVYNVQTHAVF